MSEFSHTKKSRREQELRMRQQSFSLSPALSQTKPSTPDTIRSASLATDVRDDGITAIEDVLDDVEENKEDNDEGTYSVRYDHEVLQQIANKEKSLLHIWEHGPAQFTASQDLRISYLEEKLEKAYEDNRYLEALLEVRDADFARYQDLERKQRRHASLLEDEVDILNAELVEKDKSLRLALRKLDMVRKADTVSMELSLAQMQLAKSTLALLSMQRKTKMASPHSVVYTVTRPRPHVQDEIYMAEKREWERRKEEQRKEIVTMVNNVDRIAASFDRYQNTSTIITFTEPRSEVVPDHLFTWVEQDMIAMWLFSVEPTVEEHEKYEKLLEKQSRPDPIHSPTLPKVKVNWHRLNPNMKRNLPEPVQFPLHGCAQDPEFYTSTKDVERYGGQTLYTKLVFESAQPFGGHYGFWTSQGVLAPPEEAVHGYCCSPETGTWIIAAEGG